MSIVAPFGPLAPAAARPRRLTGLGQFHVPDDAELPAASTGAAAAAAPAGLHTLLALQEADADAVQDRAAQRHAGSMLNEMAALQRALLRGDRAGLQTVTARLADVGRHIPAAADPRLAAVVRAIAMRAAIEAARNDASLFGPTVSR